MATDRRVIALLAVGIGAAAFLLTIGDEALMAFNNVLNDFFRALIGELAGDKLDPSARINEEDWKTTNGILKMMAIGLLTVMGILALAVFISGLRLRWKLTVTDRSTLNSPPVSRTERRNARIKQGRRVRRMRRKRNRRSRRR